MHVLITGAAGMIGRKLAERLVRDGRIDDQAIDRLDARRHRRVGDAGRIRREHVDVVTADLAGRASPKRLVSGRPDVIFHAAGVVSAEAELDFDKGYRSNLDGMRALLDAIRAAGDGYRPNLVFTSSCAAYGAPFPDTIGDDFVLTPHTSYGTQKVIVRAAAGRLHPARASSMASASACRRSACVPASPTRPPRGSGRASSASRWRARRRVLPVSESVLHTFASPRATIGYLLHAADLPRAQLEGRINLTMPGVCCTVAEQIAALRRVAGDKVAARIRRAPDPMIERIVAGWPHRFDPRRALALGFCPGYVVRRDHPHPHRR